MTLIIDSGNATLILERGIKGADGTLPALVMADITDKQGKVLDDPVIVSDGDIDSLMTPKGYLLDANPANGFRVGAAVLTSASDGYTLQQILSPIFGTIEMRYHDGLSWQPVVNSVTGLTVENWYNNTTAEAPNAVLNDNGSFARSVSSDEYKTGIEPMLDDYADAIVQGAQPIYYRSTCEGDLDDWSYWGISAEQLATVDQRLVHWGHSTKEVPQPLGLPPKTVLDLDSPLKPVGVQYSRIVPALLNVVKRQGDAIAALEARIQALESLAVEGHENHE